MFDIKVCDNLMKESKSRLRKICSIMRVIKFHLVLTYEISTQKFV